MNVGSRRTHLLTLAAIVGVVASCSEERPLYPQPAQYNLYVSIAQARGAAIDIIDAETDSITGRIPDAGSPGATYLRTSANGAFLASIDLGDGLSLFNLETLVTIGNSFGRLLSAEFLSDTSLLLAVTWPSPGVYHTEVFHLPSLVVDTVLQSSYRSWLSSTIKGEAVGITRSEGSILDPTWDGLIRLRVDSWSVVDSFLFRSPATEGLIRSFDATLSPDGRRVIVLAADEVGYAIFSFDLHDHTCLFRTPIATNLGSVGVTPDGREIWVTQSFWPNFQPPPSSGYALILDAYTGERLDTIRTLGLRVDRPEWPMPLTRVVFHPSEPKAYLASVWSQPSLLVVNTESREVESTLNLGLVYDMAIAPR